MDTGVILQNPLLEWCIAVPHKTVNVLQNSLHRHLKAKYQDLCSLRRHHLIGIEISIVNLRQLSDCFMVIMGIPIPIRRHLFSEWRYFGQVRQLIFIHHDDVIKWKHFPRYWPFVWGIHWSPVNSPHKGQWRRALRFSLICAWINGWVNNPEVGGLRYYRTHSDVIVMFIFIVLQEILCFIGPSHN